MAMNHDRKNAFPAGPPEQLAMLEMHMAREFDLAYRGDAPPALEHR
jgi:hypothetical protein